MFATLTPAFAFEPPVVTVVLTTPFPTAFMMRTFPPFVAPPIELVILGESDAGRQRDACNQNNNPLQPACTHNGPPL
jgi:hypothetical protein